MKVVYYLDSKVWIFSPFADSCRILLNGPKGITIYLSSVAGVYSVIFLIQFGVKSFEKHGGIEEYLLRFLSNDDLS